MRWTAIMLVSKHRRELETRMLLLLYSVLCSSKNWLLVEQTVHPLHWYPKKVKGKGLTYSLPSVGPGAGPGVQEVSPQVTISNPPGGRLPLLSTRPVVTFPAAERHRPLEGTKFYCLVTEAHRCEQLAQSCYTALPWLLVSNIRIIFHGSTEMGTSSRTRAFSP